MTDTELLDWLAAHPGAVRPGTDRYHNPCWTYKVSEYMWAPAFTLRSAISAAVGREMEICQLALEVGL